jgi:hypothetical protein
MRRFGTMALAVLIAAAVLPAAGCQMVAQKAVETATGVKVDNNGKTATIQTDKGKVEVSSEKGGSVPDGFPADFPLYKGTISQKTKMDTTDAIAYSVMIETGDPVADVIAWYKKEFPKAGWPTSAFMENSSGGDQTATFALKPHGKTEGVLTVVAESGKPTKIAISLQTKK